MCPHCGKYEGEDTSCFQTCLKMRFKPDTYTADNTAPPVVFGAGATEVKTVQSHIVAIHAVYARTDVQLSRLRAKMCMTITNCATCMESAQGYVSANGHGVSWDERSMGVTQG